MKIQSDGSVLAQTFPFSTMNVLGVKESLRISVTPLDRDFPFSTANISITYTPQAGT